MAGSIAFAASSAPSLAASTATEAANAEVLNQLPFEDRADFEDARRGLLIRPESVQITDDEGRLVWDLDSFLAFIPGEDDTPATVNPSLWRNAQLNLEYGLYEVVPGIYQVRGYDLSNFTFVRGETGWIALDAGSTPATARAALDLLTQHFGEIPVSALIYSHPHVDHYGGAAGLVAAADVASGTVEVIAPQGFMEHAISEGVIAGTAMTRRSSYMYGPLLPRNPEGSVGVGLGLATPRGAPSLIAPTREIVADKETITIDGVEMVFQLTRDTEAPVETNIYFPKFRAMWMAENVTATMHNILTLRGALVRDALSWSKSINATIEEFGTEVDVRFQSHHWPKWGNDSVLADFRLQRDLYRFIHDRAVNLMNKGYVGEEIADALKLPETLERYWGGRGYYGTLRHNVRAVYQRYMGWYDGNPSSLNALPPVEAARKYVEYMGGEDAALVRLREDVANGEYRWAATALKHLVFANPDNRAARELLAEVYRQLAYQSESGTWRSIYLQGAQELVNGVPQLQVKSSASAETILAMSPDMILDFLAVRLNAEKVAGQSYVIDIVFTDLETTYSVEIGNSVLNYSTRPAPNPDATVQLSKAGLAALLAGQEPDGGLSIEGDKAVVVNFLQSIEEVSPLFPIVEPRPSLAGSDGR